MHCHDVQEKRCERTNRHRGKVATIKSLTYMPFLEQDFLGIEKYLS